MTVTARVTVTVTVTGQSSIHLAPVAGSAHSLQRTRYRFRKEMYRVASMARIRYPTANIAVVSVNTLLRYHSTDHGHELTTESPGTSHEPAQHHCGA